MKILVTGANGFVGKNLVNRLVRSGHEVFSYDIDNTIDELENFISQADFIYHLAGINRPKDAAEFKGNHTFIDLIIELILKNKKKCPIAVTSSIQAELDNDYGRSKLKMEQSLFYYQKFNKNPVYVFRCENIFGKWCRPNYNSVVATFCYNIARGIPVSVNETAGPVPFLYIDDLVDVLISYLNRHDLIGEPIKHFAPVHMCTPKELKEIIESFKYEETNLKMPKQNDFIKKLYATYLSFLEPSEGFKYKLDMHLDDRGSFTELYKTDGFGQTSVNIIHPGITKGNHFHDTKVEKFIVVSGKCSIKFRRPFDKEVYEYVVDGSNLNVVSIPAGYTHNITNIGNDDAVVVMWASEPFDNNKPDTYFEVV